MLSDKLLEDDDIKIAGEPQAMPPDDGELAAMEFQRQKENGNIDKAYTLGKRLAELLFSSDDLVAAHCCKKQAANEVIRGNARVLFAFMVDTVLEHGCPDSMTAQTAINYFHEQVRAKSPEAYSEILESGAFSLYLLCSRDEKMSRSCIGAAFADGCDMEQDDAVVKLGDTLYNVFFAICRDELCHADFVIEA